MLCVPVFQSIQRFATGRLASKGPASSNGKIFLLVLTTQHREELHHGILIVRLKQPNRHKIHERVMQAMALFAAEEWCDLLVVMRDVMQSVCGLVGEANQTGEHNVKISIQGFVNDPRLEDPRHHSGCSKVLFFFIGLPSLSFSFKVVVSIKHGQLRIRRNFNIYLDYYLREEDNKCIVV